VNTDITEAGLYEIARSSNLKYKQPQLYFSGKSCVAVAAGVVYISNCFAFISRAGNMESYLNSAEKQRTAIMYLAVESCHIWRATEQVSSAIQQCALSTLQAGIHCAWKRVWADLHSPPNYYTVCLKNIFTIVFQIPRCWTKDILYAFKGKRFRNTRHTVTFGMPL
jgi:hypothetical protein